MTGFAIVNGAALDAQNGFEGGGIRNFGRLTLTGIDLQADRAGFGGGIADFGTLVMNPGTIVSMNRAETFDLNSATMGGVGGGLAEFGALTSVGDIFSSNTAQESGGNLATDFATNSQGQVVRNGSAKVTRATITTGTARVGAGFAMTLNESATFVNTTFNLNVAQGEPGSGGGAIANECGALTLTNDTLDANRAVNERTGLGLGGALFVDCASPDVAQRSRATIVLPRSSTAQASVAAIATPTQRHATAALDFVTMAENLAGVFETRPGVVSGGDGIAVFSAPGASSSVTLHDTIVAKKAADAGANCAALLGGTITSQGYNLENANDCGFNQTGDQVKVDPKLGALADNGGPTHTMALTTGTPAVDSADPKCDTTTDQRGISRPQGVRCDIGAFELQKATPPTATPLPSPPVTGGGGRQGGLNPSLLALFLALAAIPAAGAGLWAKQRRSA